jgi:hypothetical protein
MLLPVLQQGNEAALVGQVREQFRLNMHETDEAKVRSTGTVKGAVMHCSSATFDLLSCMVCGFHNQHAR